MYELRHNNFRRLGAALFGVLLLSIYAVQLLHTHKHDSVGSSFKGEDNYVHLSSPGQEACSICHFEFTREAMLPDLDISIRSLTVFSVFQDRLNAFFYSLSYCFIDLRGPPKA